MATSTPQNNGSGINISKLRPTSSSLHRQVSEYHGSVHSSSSEARMATSSDRHQSTVLHEGMQTVVKMYRSELGHKSEKFLHSCTSVDSFFDFVANIRLLQVPHPGSRWDKVLKWAEFFSGQVAAFTDEITTFATPGEQQAATIIWASCKSLLQMGPKFVAVLEKIFGVFYNCGITLGRFVRHHEMIHSFEELQVIFTTAYADLLKLVTGVTIHYSRRQLDSHFIIRDFDELFGKKIDDFFFHSDRFVDKIWSTRLEQLASPGDDSVEAIRNFLTPHDRVIRILAFNRRTHTPRVDFTCEWFDRHLGEFSRSDKSLCLVTGQAGSGKTVLSEWVVEKLESLKGRRATEVIRYTIDCDLKTELSTLSLIKGLLLQMLQLNAGDNSLYKQLYHAYELYIRGSPVAQVEDALWAALENGLRTDRGQTLVIDGLDQISGGETSGLAIIDRLRAIVSKHHNTKCILFSRPFTKPAATEVSHFSISSEHTVHDIHYFVQSLLSSSTFLKQKELSLLTTKLVQMAAGSFVYAQNGVNILKGEKTAEGMTKRLETLPKSLGELLDIIVSSVNLKDRDTKSLLAWVLASERPLLMAEVKQLLEIDTATNQQHRRRTRTEDDITKALGPLVDLSDGFLRFSHDLIKQNFMHRALSVTDLKNTGPFPFHIKEAHYDLTLRTVAYVKASLASRPAQSSLNVLSEDDLDRLFNKYSLVQYAARYWIVHFAQSPMNETSQQKLTSGFKACFPDSTLMALIEGSCFDHQFSSEEALNKHKLALSIRRTIIGEASEPVLQTLINVAQLWQRKVTTKETNEFYFEAWQLAISLEISSVAFDCARRYLETTSTITVTKKTDVVLHRIELLEYVINIQRSTHAASEEIITFVHTLVDIYIAIGETEKVIKWQQYVYELNLIIYGQSAPETIRSWEIISKYTKSSKTTKTSLRQEYEIGLRTMSLTDSRRIALAWSMIETYEKEKDFVKMEEVLISLWQSLTSLTHTYDVSILEKRTEIALRYVEFLKLQKRITEAEIILRGINADLERIEIRSSTLIKYTKIVGEQFRSIGSITAARLVFVNLWNYYVRTGKQETSEAKSVSTSITEITTSTTEETTWDVTTTRETFERTIVNSTTTTIDINTVRISTSLITTYYSEQKWSEVVKVSTSIITRLWPSFSSNNINSPLPSSFTTESLEILRRLAFSYVKLRQIESAEMVYRKIFYGARASPACTDELLTSTSKTLIEFYETHSMTSKIVIVYRDLHHDIERRHGKTNTWTIKTLYLLGDLSMKLYDISNAEAAYRSIYNNLSKDEVCLKDAIRATLALGDIYEQQRQYTSAQKMCNSLWQMLLKHGKEYNLKPDFATELYQRYVRITRNTPGPHYSPLRQLALDFRKVCIVFYGVNSEITINATLRLAEIDEDDEQYHEEAIAMYEEADAKAQEATKGSVSETVLSAVAAARRKLPYLYSTSKLYTSAKAVTLYRQEFKKYQTEKGYTHRDTLLWLGHLTTALMKQGNADSSTQAQHLLRSAILEVLKHEKNSQILSDAAVTFADFYRRGGLDAEAVQLVKQLRTNAVFGNAGSKDKLEAHTWVFLVTFESTVTERKELYSSIMADLFTEVFMNQLFHRSIAQKASFSTVLSYASRLLSFLRDVEDESGFEFADRQTLEYFTNNLGGKTSQNSAILHDFMHTVLSYVNEDDVDMSVLRAGLETTSSYLSKGKVAEARELVQYIDRFQHFYGGYNSLAKIDMGLRLALILDSHKSVDAQTGSSLLELSGSIMKQVIEQFRKGEFELVDMPILDLNSVCGLLGRMNDLENLEWVLSQLWNARHTQTSWSSSTIVHIGRLLVETQFSRGHTEEAIHLCEDMTYNVRRVWGSLDPTTLEMQNLLSSLYTSSSNHAKAMRIHAELIRETINDAGDELPTAEACLIAVKQINLLKRTYQRLGKWDRDPHSYVDLFQRVAQNFEAEETWKNAKVESIEKWQPKGADDLGVWHRPAGFEFMETTGVRHHENRLRQSSGAWIVVSHSNGRTGSAGSVGSLHAELTY